MDRGGGARVLGRYVLHDEFASGGMASVHFGRLVAEGGFKRTVAIKRLHPQHAKDPTFVAMLLDEARLAARIRHPNVTPILDVVAEDGEVFLVMEYVHGESLAALLRNSARAGVPVPLGVATCIVAGALRGLAAAHDAVSEAGEPLGIVHRDVSPENVLVGVEGTARVLDFGVALAQGRSQVTREGGLKGKLGYMAPELLEGEKATPLSDVYSAGVVLWETLVQRRLYTGEHEGAVLAAVLRGRAPRPSELIALPPGLDDVVMTAMSRRPGDRFASAEAFASALEAALPPAAAREVARFVQALGGEGLAQRAAMISAMEGAPAPDPRSSVRGAGPDVAPPEPPRAAALAPIPTEVLPQAPAMLGPTSPGVRTTVVAVPSPRGARIANAASAAEAASAANTSPAAPPAASLETARTRRTGAILVAVVALLAGGVVAAGARALARDRQPSPPTPSASTPGDSVATSATSATRPLPAVDARTSATTESPPPDASSAPSAAPAADLTALPLAPPNEPTPKGTRPRSKPRARPDCTPPYTVDERGIHHYKPNCL